jgi:hypothetical protein
MRVDTREREVTTTREYCLHCGGPLVVRYSALRRRDIRVCLGSWKTSEPGSTRLPCGAPHWSSRGN